MILYSIHYLLNDIYCDVINGSFLYEHIAYNSENEQWLQFVGKKFLTHGPGITGSILRCSDIKQAIHHSSIAKIPQKILPSNGKLLRYNNEDETIHYYLQLYYLY